jgi:hypothetical protein
MLVSTANFATEKRDLHVGGLGAARMRAAPLTVVDRKMAAPAPDEYLRAKPSTVVLLVLAGFAAGMLLAQRRATRSGA